MIENCPYSRPDADTVCSDEALLYFVWEREAIRIAKENLHPAPWTEDNILGDYRFCNIRRRDDRVSRWIVNNLMRPNEGDKNLWFTLLIARIVNWPPSLEELLRCGVLPSSPERFEAQRFVSVMDDLQARGKKIYTGAYMIYPTKLSPGTSKSASVAQYIIADVVKNAELIREALRRPPRIEPFVQALSKCYGLSTFMAGQVAADLTYSNDHLGFALDLNTYAPIGPGSSRGLNYLLGRNAGASWKQDAFNNELIYVRKNIREYLHISDLTLHDVQNIMCEYGKYVRAVLEEASPRARYVPETEF